MAGDPLPVADLATAAGVPPEFVVEDAAHALGARRADGSPVGSGAASTCFSFYATKNLPIGEGGAIATDDLDLAARLRATRLHGMSHDAWRRYLPGGSWRYDVPCAGLKANLTDVQAAIGRAQLHHLDAWQLRRAEIAGMYDDAFDGVPGLLLPPRTGAGAHAWHLYILRVTDRFPVPRDELAERLAARGIGTSVHFTPVHRLTYFAEVLGAHEAAACPEADLLFDQILSIPLHPQLGDADVRRVCEAVLGLARAE
jgi:perosamine synthetase